MIKADGYVKYKLQGRKFYRAQTRIMGNIRYSAKIFKRATDALQYSNALVARYKRLKAAEKIDTPQSA